MRHIISDPHFLNGKPFLGGARLSVELILDELILKKNTRDVAKKYPQITEDDVIFVIQYAQRLVNKHPEDADIQRPERNID
ncbi:MAG: antitoxin [Candidatus Melainabacteria bacterium HGW-Melainabacteria-1]|nr:MAG: antitoxin [Candidatus Melainabacteria bacterium HGW-Melainabacteria-1]